MNPYIEKLKTYLQDIPSCRENGSSILELLCYYYTEENLIETTMIRARFQKMDAILSKLSIQDNDAIFGLTVEICSKYIEQAFLTGARTGAQLILELQQSEQRPPLHKGGLEVQSMQQLKRA